MVTNWLFLKIAKLRIFFIYIFNWVFPQKQIKMFDVIFIF